MKGILNEKAKGTQLYEIEMIPKGEREVKTVFVYAKNRLDASNWLIMNSFYGKQINIRVHSSELLK